MTSFHNKLPAFFLPCALLALCLSTTAMGPKPPPPLTFETLQQKIQPLLFEAPPLSYPDTVQRYFRYYGLDIEGVPHLFGGITSGKLTLATHVYRPEQSKATVLIMHGYYDHAGIVANLIGRLVQERYTVVVYDQPGHGLSDGDRASIRDFADYTTAFRDVMKVCRGNLEGPVHIVAHSMGCAIVTDYLLTTENPPLKRIVFLAPLYRSAHWTLSGIGHSIAGRLVDSIPRIFRANSSDKAFCEFLRRDPLQTRYVPTQWLRAHRRWVKQAADYPPSPHAITLIQGDRDRIVAWEHNLPFLQAKFPNSHTSLIPGARHQLLNESPTFLKKILDLITARLERLPDRTLPE